MPISTPPAEFPALIEAAVATMEEGINWASDLAPGDTFLGADRAAEAAGHAKGSLGYRLFIAGALEILDYRNIYLHPETGIIERLDILPGRKRPTDQSG